MCHPWTRCLSLVFLAGAMCGPLLAAGPMNLKSVLIKDVPHVTQKPDFCGEACAEMFLTKLDPFFLVVILRSNKV